MGVGERLFPSVKIRFNYKAYRRSFAGSFSNAREQFPKREGLLIRIEDRDGRVGFGEVAPIPSFGSESFPSALTMAVSLEERLEMEPFLDELEGYPAFRWACESALEMIEQEGAWPTLEKPWAVCGLVSDLCDEQAISERLEMHYQGLKFKIGKGKVSDEMRALDRVVNMSDAKVQLRLDANGMLSVAETTRWLEWAAENPVEFIEQPLAKGEELEMRKIGSDFPTPLALDESVGSVDELKRWRDQQWLGLYVIKPSLSGGFRSLADELASGASDCVFSSALETKVGASNAISFALRFGDQSRSLGFGVEQLFADRNVGLTIGPFLQNGMLASTNDLDTLWNQI